MPSPCPKFLGNLYLPKTQQYSIRDHARPHDLVTTQPGVGLCACSSTHQSTGMPEGTVRWRGEQQLSPKLQVGGMRWELWFSGSFPERGKECSGASARISRSDVMSKELCEIRGLSARACSALPCPCLEGVGLALWWLE